MRLALRPAKGGRMQPSPQGLAQEAQHGGAQVLLLRLQVHPVLTCLNELHLVADPCPIQRLAQQVGVKRCHELVGRALDGKNGRDARLHLVDGGGLRHQAGGSGEWQRLTEVGGSVQVDGCLHGNRGLLGDAGRAQIITVPSAFTRSTGAAHWLTLLRARAIENQCFIVAANQCGTVSGTSFYGHSAIIDPWGKVLAEAGGRPEVIVASVDFSVLEDVRRRLPSLATAKRMRHRCS